MTQTRWAIDETGGTTLELGGRKFSSGDEGAPMMCNLVCSSIGRHIHISNCRVADGDPCSGADVQHISKKLTPDPDKPKDAITHGLYWRRTGALIVFLLSLCLNDIPRLQRLRTHFISSNN